MNEFQYWMIFLFCLYRLRKTISNKYTFQNAKIKAKLTVKRWCLMFKSQASSFVQNEVCVQKFYAENNRLHVCHLQCNIDLSYLCKKIITVRLPVSRSDCWDFKRVAKWHWQTVFEVEHFLTFSFWNFSVIFFVCFFSVECWRYYKSFFQNQILRVDFMHHLKFFWGHFLME